MEDFFRITFSPRAREGVSGASERVSTCGAREFKARAVRSVASECERCERTSERTSEWPSVLSYPDIHFVTFLEGLEAEGMKTCLELDKPWNHYIVVDRDNETAFQCTNPLHLNEDGTWDKTLQDSVKSFPSAHSSISFYGMLFLAGYFQKRANFYKYASVLTIFFQMTFIVVAFSIALSR